MMIEGGAQLMSIKTLFLLAVVMWTIALVLPSVLKIIRTKRKDKHDKE